MSEERKEMIVTGSLMKDLCPAFCVGGEMKLGEKVTR